NIVAFGGPTQVAGTDSPGESNYRLLTQIVINEALTHTDRPLEDAIELRNLTAQSIDISGWWLSDDPHGALQKYQIPANTILAANPYPRVGPIIISEIMYHPPDLNGADNSRDEFIELRNITTVPVPLFDPAAPTNTWHLRDAVDFNFPTNITLQPGQTLLLVSFDPINNPSTLAAFRNVYQIDP